MEEEISLNAAIGDQAWGGRTPRAWQVEALPLALAAMREGKKGVVAAVMGAGKSVFLAELAATARLEREGTVVITTSSQDLVRQLAATVAARVGEQAVGQFFSDVKQASRPVIVCCQNSAPKLAEALAARGRQVGTWIADECHKTEGGAMLAAAQALTPAARIGLTATPFRSDDRESLSLWDTLVYRYGPGDAIRDGVIVPWRVISWEGGEIPVDDAVIEMIAKADGPGVINAVSIRDAEEYSARLTGEGIPALAIHSKLKVEERQRRLALLRAGELRALVHVALLVEGVDLPWLRWMALRRPVAARVRFMQEIGRALRASEGKDYATFYDPHDLFGDHGVSYEEALGWRADAPVLTIPREERDDDVEGLPMEERLVRAKTAVELWLRRIHLAAQADELVAVRQVAGKGWRAAPPSTPQLQRLERLAGAAWDLPVGQALCHDLAAGGNLPNSGAAADLIDILSAVGHLKRKGESWQPSTPLDEPPGSWTLQVLGDMIEQGPWSVGVARRDQWWAVAVCKGGRVKFERAWTVSQPQNWWAVLLRTIATIEAHEAEVQVQGVRTLQGHLDGRLYAQGQGDAADRITARALRLREVEQTPAKTAAWRCLGREIRAAGRFGAA